MLGYSGLTAEALERAGALLGDCLGELDDEDRGTRVAGSGSPGIRSHSGPRSP